MTQSMSIGISMVLLRRFSRFVSIELLMQRLRSPSNRFLLNCLNSTFSLYCLIFCRPNSYSKAIFIWDVRAQPVTFDFVFVIFYAYLQLLSKGFDEFELHIFAPPEACKTTSWRDYNKYVSDSDVLDRISNLIVPLGQAFTCISDVKVINSFSDLRDKRYPGNVLLYPFFYNPQYFYPASLNYRAVFSELRKHRLAPLSYPCIDPCRLDAPFRKVGSDSSFQYSAEKYIAPPFGSYITLTLRDYGFSPERNTSQYDIDLIAEFSRLHGFAFVVIPDELIASRYAFPADACIVAPARLCLRTRMQIYKESACNLFPPSGPAALSYFINGTKTIVFNYGVPGVDSDLSYNFKHYRIMYGDQPYIILGGRLIWCEFPWTYTLHDLNIAYQALTSHLI